MRNARWPREGGFALGSCQIIKEQLFNDNNNYGYRPDNLSAPKVRLSAWGGLTGPVATEQGTWAVWLCTQVVLMHKHLLFSLYPHQIFVVIGWWHEGLCFVRAAGEVVGVGGGREERRGGWRLIWPLFSIWFLWLHLSPDIGGLTCLH